MFLVSDQNQATVKKVTVFPDILEPKAREHNGIFPRFCYEITGEHHDFAFHGEHAFRHQ